MGPSAADVEAGKQPIRIIIQWETSSAKGVSMALTDKDNRPFIDKDGKLYFGWPISSEITEQAGNVKFNVRFYQFSGETQTAVDESGNIIYDENGFEKQVPILAFGLNTQTQTVKINQALNYDIDGTTLHNQQELALFKDAELILGKNETVLNRIQNSTKFYDEDALKSDAPVFIENINIEGFETITVGEDTFAVMDLGGANKTQPLEFQVFAKPAEGLGFISYYGQSKAQPDNAWNQIMTEPYMINDANVIYVRETNSVRQEGIKYYIKNELNQFIRATNLPDAGEAWRHDDVNNDYEEDVAEEPVTLKYYVLKSPLFKVTQPGYFYIIANNKQGQRQATQLDSNKVFVPYPTPLTDENVIGGGTVDKPAPDFLQEGKINSTILVDAADGDSVIYQWNHKNKNDGTWAIVVGQNNATFDGSNVEISNPGLFDEVYSVTCQSSRNNATSAQITKYFRVTDLPHKFTFDTTTTKLYSGVQDEMPEISVNFEQNLAGSQLTFLSDSIKYRWYQVIAPELDERIGDEIVRKYDDDIIVYPPQPEEGEGVWAEAATYSDVASFKPEHAGAYYCEIINVVNGSESTPSYTGYVDADDVEYI